MRLSEITEFDNSVQAYLIGLTKSRGGLRDTEITDRFNKVRRMRTQIKNLQTVVEKL